MARCFVTRRIPGPALDRLVDEHDVDVWPHRLPPTPDELREHVAGVEGLLSLLTDTVDEALLDAAPDLRAISNYAVGTDNVDLEAASARGIPVGNTPDVLTDATADLAFALLLALARRLPEGERDVREGQWVTFEPDRSSPAESEYLFSYTVRISNVGDEVVQLLARHWVITNATRNVYIFGDHARGEAAPASKLKIAIEYEANVSDDMMRSWQQENSTDFAELERALGIETELYVDQDYDVWPPIRDAARAPVMAVRKVRVVRTPAL